MSSIWLFHSLLKNWISCFTSKASRILRPRPFALSLSKGKQGVKTATIVALFLLSSAAAGEIDAQESAGAPGGQKELGEIRLRRTIGEREYKGRSVEGEDRAISRGDSLWRILIQEKGLPEKRFNQYLIVIRGLNPRIKKLDALRVGDILFIPLRPDELLSEQPPLAKQEAARTPIARETTKDYRVKQGDHLYQILREQLGIYEERALAQHYALVKDLNPEKKNWERLQEGEVIRLPVLIQASETASAGSKITTEPKSVADAKPDSAAKPVIEAGAEVKSPAPVSPTLRVSPAERTGVAIDHPNRIPARENFALLGQVIEALGNEVQRGGQEVFALKDGTIRIDRNAYPIIYNPKLRQKVIVDLEDKIPPALRSKLGDANVAIPVVPMTNGSSLHEAVGQLLARLGYQSLPADRPVVIQEGGIAYEAKGSWMALAPEESGKAQEIFVITLTDGAGEIPEYLTKELSRKGLHLKDIPLPSDSTQEPGANRAEAKESRAAVKHWARDKREIVDNLLLAYGIAFGVSETRSVELHEGFRFDLRTDRVFETKGKQNAMFFQRTEPEVKKILQEKYGIKVIELELSALSHKELITRMLSELGETVVYREHRFPAASGGSKDRLSIAASGFLLSNRAMFLTDREIPQSLHRFFFEKGLEIVYFQ